MYKNSPIITACFAVLNPRGWSFFALCNNLNAVDPSPRFSRTTRPRKRILLIQEKIVRTKISRQNLAPKSFRFPRKWTWQSERFGASNFETRSHETAVTKRQSIFILWSIMFQNKQDKACVSTKANISRWLKIFAPTFEYWTWTVQGFWTPKFRKWLYYQSDFYLFLFN